MPVSRTTLTHIAALSCAIPGLTVRIATDGGNVVTIGDEADASMCGCAFRHYVATWPENTGHEPCVAGVTYDGAEAMGGILALGHARWFVSDLNVYATADCIRSSDLPVVTRVYEDGVLGVCVVKIEQASDEIDIDEAALALYGAILVEDLVGVPV